MKKIKTTMILMTCLFMTILFMPINVSASSVEVDTESELREALESGKSVTLTSDIVIESETTKVDKDVPIGIVIEGKGNVTIEGNNHTISTSYARTIFEIYATGSEKLNVTLNNVILESNKAGGRCIDTRTSNIILNINESKLSTTKKSYDQALTIGGDAYTTPIEVNLKNTDIKSVYYAIIAFNPVNLSIDGGTSVGGYAAIYMKENSKDSKVSINNAKIVGANVSTAPVCAENATKCNPYTNDFGTIVLEDVGIEIDANNSTIKSTEASTATEYIVLDSTQDETKGNIITIKDSTVNVAKKVAKIYNSNTKIIVGDKTITNFDVPEEYLATDAIVKKTSDNEYTVYEPHTITIKEMVGGKVEVNTTKAYLGDKVELTVKANDGYILKSIGYSFVGENAGADLTGRNEFNMADKDIEITAVFEKVTTSTDIPVIDTKKEVEEVTVGVKEESKVEDVLLDSLKANKDLAEKAKDTSIKVVVDINSLDKTKLDEKIKSAIEEKAGKGTIAEYFDISVLVKNAKDSTKIGTLSELTEEIELMVMLPESLKNTNKDVNRNYFVIREHEGKIEKLDAKLSSDGKYITFKSKDFSTYALAYEDAKVEDKPVSGNATPSAPETENPKTGDNIALYAIAGIISVCGLGVIVKKKKFN